MIQKKIMSIINDIIPLDFICLILDTLQVLMDDINFFTSLFQMSGPFLNYLNTFQNFLNQASNFVSNPFSTIYAYLPSDVKNIIDTVNQIGTDPNGFIADKLNNYGYGYVLNALQGNLVAAAVNKFGPQYASITPLGNILSKATAIYQRYGAQYPPTPAVIGPSIFTGTDGRSLNTNSNPIAQRNISHSAVSDVSQATQNLGTNIGNIIGGVGTNLQNDFCAFGAGLSEASCGFQGIPNDISNAMCSVGNTFNKIIGKK